jgi:hypothetical protein
VSEPPFVLVGHADGEHLRITVRGRLHPRATDFWDGSWLDTPIEIRAGAFRATLPAALRTTELALFAQQLQALHETLRGEAVLETMEDWITLRLSGDGRGHVSARGTLQDQPGMGNTLAFSLPRLDQTDLPPLLRALREIERAFPTLRDPAE